MKANSAERKWKMMAVTCVIATVLCGLVFAAILLFNHLSAGNNSLQVLFYNCDLLTAVCLDKLFAVFDIELN